MSFGKRGRSAKRFEVSVRVAACVVGRPDVGCTVSNISESGALVTRIDNQFIPKQFELRFDFLPSVIHCETVSVDTFGTRVRFVSMSAGVRLALQRWLRALS